MALFFSKNSLIVIFPFTILSDSSATILSSDPVAASSSNATKKFAYCSGKPAPVNIALRCSPDSFSWVILRPTTSDRIMAICRYKLSVWILWERPKCVSYLVVCQELWTNENMVCIVRLGIGQCTERNGSDILRRQKAQLSILGSATETIAVIAEGSKRSCEVLCITGQGSVKRQFSTNTPHHRTNLASK